MLSFFLGTAVMVALGWFAERYVRSGDWKRSLAIGIGCFGFGGGAALYASTQEVVAAAGTGAPGTHTGIAAEVLIAVALAWFGALLCGIAAAEARRFTGQPPVPVPPAPAADPDATLTDAPPAAPDGRKDPS